MPRIEFADGEFHDSVDPVMLKYSQLLQEMVEKAAEEDEEDEKNATISLPKIRKKNYDACLVIIKAIDANRGAQDAFDVDRSLEKDEMQDYSGTLETMMFLNVDDSECPAITAMIERLTTTMLTTTVEETKTLFEN